MFREIISGKEEDYSIFLHCLCGKEIIQIYYYKEDTILHKIIGLRYYGQIKEEKNLIYGNFQFSESSFFNFIYKMEEFLNSNEPKSIYMSSEYGEDILQLLKDEEDFFKLIRYKDLNEAKKDKDIWDIMFRKPEAKEFLDILKKIKSQILEDNNNNKVEKKIWY